MLQDYLVDAKDRKYQFRERNSLSIDLWSPKVFMQKLNYIHNNPTQVKWLLARNPEDHKYSSANYYYTGIDAFGFLSTIKDNYKPLRRCIVPTLRGCVL